MELVSRRIFYEVKTVLGKQMPFQTLVPNEITQKVKADGSQVLTGSDSISCRYVSQVFR
jgi:hypothetical protein